MFSNIIVRAFCGLFLITAFLATGCGSNKTDSLNIAAASSLTGAITEINKLYMEQHRDIEVNLAFAASGDLSKQIKNGAPVDLFISASVVDLDELAVDGLIINETRRDLLGNSIVLVAPSSSGLKLDSFTDLLAREVESIAIGDPTFVPAGRYAVQTFSALGFAYVELEPKLIFTANVMQILSYIESGNVDAGIVFLSDTYQRDLLVVKDIAPETVNHAIIYPAAVIAASPNLEPAEDFLRFLTSEEAAAVFTKYGFHPLADR